MAGPKRHPCDQATLLPMAAHELAQPAPRPFAGTHRVGHAPDRKLRRRQITGNQRAHGLLGPRQPERVGAVHDADAPLGLRDLSLLGPCERAEEASLVGPVDPEVDGAEVDGLPLACSGFQLEESRLGVFAVPMSGQLSSEAGTA